ncbi:MAG: 3-hydroxylacyl-ACP dehydratase [Gammaproteobacteria bacterium]|nr:3-hydroxylacyl-ACP dehydratase [Gammaproteobacteria bacterium]
MRLGRDAIARRVPHTGAMCLLDEVLDWDAQRLRCRSHSHRHGENPLRAGERLGAACAVEYAAQAAALHGALLREANDGAPSRVPPGRLASVRGLRLRIARLDDAPHGLLCAVRLLASDANVRQYAFEVGGDRASLAWVEGRLAIVTAPTGEASG